MEFAREYVDYLKFVVIKLVLFGKFQSGIEYQSTLSLFWIDEIRIRLPFELRIICLFRFIYIISFNPFTPAFLPQPLISFYGKNWAKIWPIWVRHDRRRLRVKKCVLRRFSILNNQFVGLAFWLSNHIWLASPSKPSLARFVFWRPPLDRSVPNKNKKIIMEPIV